MASITLYTTNILEDGTVTVTGTPDTGYPEARLYDREISLFWKDTVTEAKTFHVDYGSAVEVDFLAIHRHNFSGEDMQWQYSTDDFSADINDAVTDWSQSDNNQITKEMSSSQTKRYWRITLTSMENPRCGEIFMSLGRSFDVLAEPNPEADELDNVQWNKSFGGVERSTKYGSIRRRRRYGMFLSASDLSSFQAAVDDLDDYEKPFWLKDHTGAYFPVRFEETPVEQYSNKTYTRVDIMVQEII